MRQTSLKLLFIVIDGMGDLPIPALDNKTPLEAARTPNLDSLVKVGKTGLMYTVGEGIAPESDVAVISLLGYDPFKYSTGRGVIEVAGAGLKMKDGDLALRCNFATLGKGKKLIDRRVNRSLSSKEADELSDAVNKEVELTSYPVSFEFKNMLGHRAVLLIRSKDKPLSSNISNTDPAYKIVNGIGVAQIDVEMVLKTAEPMDETEAARVSAGLVNEFIAKSNAVWENHPLNVKRAAEGKLKANAVITRDAGHLLPKFFNISQRYGLSFACLADMPTESGIAQLAGMDATLLPAPSGDLKADMNYRVNALVDTMSGHDCFYIHLKGPDEPGHDGNYKLKLELIEGIDKYFFGPLLKQISLEDTLICVTSDHATPCKLKVHSDTPVALLIAGGSVDGDGRAVEFSEKNCAEGSLGTLLKGYLLMPMLMEFFKK